MQEIADEAAKYYGWLFGSKESKGSLAPGLRDREAGGAPREFKVTESQTKPMFV